MTKPISVCVISDDNACSSGFARVVRELMTRIYKMAQGGVDVWQVCLYPIEDDAKRHIASYLNRSEDPAEQRLLDEYGVRAFTRAVQQQGKQPDVILLLGDWWYWSATLLSPEWRKRQRIYSQVWYYCPVDGVQMDSDVFQAYKGADLCISMSPFGHDEIKRMTGTEPFYLPHGYDPTVFRHQERPLVDDWIRFGVVARNSPRKNLWAILCAFKQLPKDVTASLILHVPDDDLAGGNPWNYTRHQAIEHVEFTGLSKITDIKAGATTVHAPVGCHDHELCSVYGNIDALVVAGREGFGLPILEARACGCHLILPDYSAPASMDYAGAQVYRVKHYQIDHTSRDILDMQPDPDELTAQMIEAWELLHDRRPEPLDRSDLHWDTLARQLLVLILERGRCLHLQHISEARAVLEDKRIHVRNEILVTMPEAHGDVLLLTATLDGLRRKYPDQIITVATGEPYRRLLDGCPSVDMVITYNPYLHDNYMELHRQYQAVYTPHFETQRAANWVHGGDCLCLAEVYAAHCGVDLGRYYVNADDSYGPDGAYLTLHTGSGNGNQSARAYDHWQEVVNLLESDERIPPVYLVGERDDLAIKAAYDERGRTSLPQLMGLLGKAVLHVGIDSFPMHAAAIRGTRSVILWGNTWPHATGPEPRLRESMIALTPDDYSPCVRPCHCLECYMGDNCINRIQPQSVYEAVLSSLGIQ